MVVQGCEKDDGMISTQMANAVNFLFLLAVTLCVVVGFYSAMQGDDPARGGADEIGDAPPATQIHANGKGKR
jgi:hypothetical protein